MSESAQAMLEIVDLHGYYGKSHVLHGVNLHFKTVNDEHGHDAGDRLLAAFAQQLLGDCRISDVVCRYGGEEFCLLMPGTRAASAARKLGLVLARWR